MSDETPVIVVTVAAPVEAVWDALRDKEKIRHWHGWEDPGLDAEIDLIYLSGFSEDEDDGVRTLNVQGGDRFVVEPHEGGSKVTLTRAPHGANPEWEAYYDDITEGWITFVHQLAFALERHPGEPRRTLFYGGVSGTRPAELFGITGAAGSEYAAELCGEAASGRVWFRSENQVGVTVDQWGDGLLVLSHQMAVLSLYGVDDAGREAIDKRWSEWWSAHYPAEESAG